MRFCVELLLKNENIPKDKNRVILSILKTCFKNYSQSYYENLYCNDVNKVKEFTFSSYLGNCKFLKNEIIIPGKKMILNFSVYSAEDGIMFFNSILNAKGKSIPIKNNSITISKINLVQERNIHDKQIVFKTMSPIVVREHKGENKNTWYHSLNTKEGQTIFRNNLRYQLVEAFGEEVLIDFKDLEVETSQNCKIVKVKNYGIEVHSNLCKLRVSGQPYILNYLYKAGIGSKRGSGFGMVGIA